MSKGTVNKVVLIGSLGEDPTCRMMNNNQPVANLSLATTESWKDQGGQPQEKTEWHRLVAYRGLAKISQDYLCKGSKIYIEGKLVTRKWQDKEGKDQYSTEIEILSIEMLGGKRIENAQQNNNQGGYQQQPNQQNNQGGYQQQRPNQPQQNNQGGYQQQRPNQQQHNNQYQQ
jgi:single-strand DNA-binding protein